MKTLRNKREICPICSSDKKEHLCTLKEMPIYFGCSNKVSEIKNDQTYVICKNCSCIYIKQLIDPDLLYSDNHNTDVVGETWKKHYQTFYNFIFSDKFPKKRVKVFEIGDPSAKLASLCKLDEKVSSWVILEPSKNLKKKLTSKISYINDWYKEKYVRDLEYDLIIMSHVFEHLQDPKLVFDSLYETTKEKTVIYLSVPNLQEILCSKKMSPAGLHFEHTFYYDNLLLENFFRASGWLIEKCEDYKNHSIFIKLKKTNKKQSKFKYNDRNKSLFIDSIHEIKMKINIINNEMSKCTSEIYLYGAHIQTQIMLNLGLKQEKIKNILDNSKQKQQKRLYGTNLIVKNPIQELSTGKECMVICHMGHYTEEIKKELLKVNCKVRFV